jgi:hypothetical protein
MSTIRELVEEASQDRWTTSASQVGRGVQILNEQLAAEQRFASSVKNQKNDLPIPNLSSRQVNTPLPNDVEIESDHNRLKRRLQEFALVEHNVKTDGNCQYRALSFQLYENENKHEYVRKAVCEQLQKYHNTYKDYIYGESWTSFIQRMQQDGEWGDHVTLQAFADRFGTSVHLVTSYESNEFIQVNPQAMFESQMDSNPFLLGFWAEVHYNPVIVC